jgi:hypothetical protein
MGIVLRLPQTPPEPTPRPVVELSEQEKVAEPTKEHVFPIFAQSYEGPQTGLRVRYLEKGEDW